MSAGSDMPLPSKVEEAVTKAAGRASDNVDALLLAAFISLDVSALPTWTDVKADLEKLVRVQARRVLRESGEPTKKQVDALTKRILSDLREKFVVAVAEMRRQIRLAKKKADDPKATTGVLTAAGWLALVVAVANGTATTRTRSVVIAARKVTKAGRVTLDVLKLAAKRFTVPAATRRVPFAAQMKTIIRTELAKGRNEFAADVADEQDLVLRIVDALLGNDEGCLEVDGKYATPEWLRNHLVEHPNCTRQGVPSRLPEGRKVTLR